MFITIGQYGDDGKTLVDETQATVNLLQVREMSVSPTAKTKKEDLQKHYGWRNASKDVRIVYLNGDTSTFSNLPYNVAEEILQEWKKAHKRAAKRNNPVLELAIQQRQGERGGR